jgi:transcriptional regulator with XRE-family HTH domain
MTDATQTRRNLAADFSKRVRTAREAHGWTQSEFARHAELTQPQVSRLEAGGAVPNSAMLVRVASSLEVSTDYLLGLCDNPRWRDPKDQDLMHLALDAVPPKDRPLARGFLLLLLQRNL